MKKQLILLTLQVIVVKMNYIYEPVQLQLSFVRIPIQLNTNLETPKFLLREIAIKMAGESDTETNASNFQISSCNDHFKSAWNIDYNEFENFIQTQNEQEKSHIKLNNYQKFLTIHFNKEFFTKQQNLDFTQSNGLYLLNQVRDIFQNNQNEQQKTKRQMLLCKIQQNKKLNLELVSSEQFLTDYQQNYKTFIDVQSRETLQQQIQQDSKNQIKKAEVKLIQNPNLNKLIIEEPKKTILNVQKKNDKLEIQNEDHQNNSPIDPQSFVTQNNKIEQTIQSQKNLSQSTNKTSKKKTVGRSSQNEKQTIIDISQAKVQNAEKDSKNIQQQDLLQNLKINLEKKPANINLTSQSFVNKSKITRRQSMPNLNNKILI